MKKVQFYEEFANEDECACGGNCQCGTTTKVNEQNADGTISDDEDEAIEDLMTNIEFSIDELITYVKTNADEIGGSFRSPGIEAEAAKLIKSKLKKAKLIR
jgi:hypothetical protein